MHRPAPSVSEYTLADQVFHPMFGDGTVKTIDGDILTIKFADNITKQIPGHLKLASLQYCSGDVVIPGRAPDVPFIALSIQNSYAMVLLAFSTAVVYSLAVKLSVDRNEPGRSSRAGNGMTIVSM